MDANNSINVQKKIYESGLVFNINKLNFNWKDLYKFEELKNILQRNKIQNFYSINTTKNKFPTLILDKENVFHTQDSSKILHMSVCLPCYDEEWCEISGTLRSLSKNILSNSRICLFELRK